MFFKRRLLLLLFLLGSFLFLLHSSWKDSWPVAGYIDRFLVRVYQPVASGLSSVSSFFKKGVSGYFFLVGVSKENSLLKEQLAALDQKILFLNEELKRIHQSQDTDRLTSSLGDFIAADVISFDPLALSKTIWISAGYDKGVKVNQPVVASLGLVGRVVKVFPQTAQVLLLIDSRFSVDVLDENTRVKALVSGLGDTVELKRYPFLSQMEYLNLGDEIHPGDLLMTSGLSPIYPKGIPVGTVMDIKKGDNDLFQTALVLPKVDMGKLEQVRVLKTPQ